MKISERKPLTMSDLLNKKILKTIDLKNSIGRIRTELKNTIEISFIKNCRILRTVGKHNHKINDFEKK